MSWDKPVRSSFSVVWAAADGLLLLGDVDALLRHPKPVAAQLELALAATLLAIPSIVWRYAGSCTQYLRTKPKLSPADLSIQVYFLRLRGRFVATYALAELTITTMLVRAFASLHVAR